MVKKLPIKIDLSEGFLDEEIRYNYNISSDMKAVWAVQLDLLAELSRVCNMLNVNYYLDSGNLLGAVRDGKFIPWDDDIDVVMLRKDYDILVKMGRKLFTAPYFLQCPFTDKEYTRPHAQLRNSKTCAAMRNEGSTVVFNQGIFIDIFVLDGIAVGREQEQIEKVQEIIRPAKYISFHHSKNMLIEFIKRIRALVYIARYGGLHTIFNEMEDYIRGFAGSSYIDKITFREDYRQVKKLKKEWFEEYETLLFEGYEVKVPSHYDEVLKIYYGDDYMTPRQEDTMHGVNGGMIFDAYTPYNEVLKIY